MIELNFPDPVTSEDGFFDRRREWSQIERTFRSKESKPAIILGERRIGKTSLQSIAARRLQEDASLEFKPVFMPFGPYMRSMDDFARELIQGLYTFADQDVRENGSFTMDEGFRLSSLGEYTQTLRDLISQLSVQEFLVCIDEFDETLRNCVAEDGERLVALVTHLVNERERNNLPIRFFFAMTGLPDTITQSFGTPFTSNAMLVRLRAFSYKDMAHMVSTLLTQEAEVSEAAMKYLYEFSGGHPYLTKLILDCLLEPYAFEAQGLFVDEAEIEEASLQAADDPRPRSVLANLYDVHLDSYQKELMLLLAERRAGVTKQELKIFGADYLTAAETLVLRDYWDKTRDETDPEKDRYFLRIAFLGRWLRRWERFESEAEKRLKDIRRKLRRMVDPWDEVQPTVVTDEDLRKFGLRP